MSAPLIRTATAPAELPDSDVLPLKKKKIDLSYSELIAEPNVMYLKPSSAEPLALLLRDVLPQDDNEEAYRVFRHKTIAKPGTAAYREVAAGEGADEDLDYAGSSPVGYFDRSIDFPYCRTTAFNLKHPRKFRRALPYIRAVEEQFRLHLPSRYNAQLLWATATYPDWLVSEVFSTVTINKNWRTRVHTDQGDYKPGFGVITCFRRGPVQGGELILPKFRLGVDLRERDVLLVDVHECHGNAPLVGNPFEYERISCVFYLRTRIAQCGTRQQELRRIQSRKVGEPLFGWVMDKEEFGKPFVSQKEQRKLAAESDDDEDVNWHSKF